VMVLLNLILVATPFTRFTWDSETHLWFSDHYRRGWLDPWEEKWFGGMWVFGYPPLTHQLLALLSFQFDPEVAYKIVQMLALVAFPPAVWVFAREFVDEDSADWSAILAAAVPGIYIVLYVFGQLPSFLGMVLGLLAAGFLARYIRNGRRASLFACFCFAGAAAAAHHHTVLFVVPLLAIAVLAHRIILSPVAKYETMRRGMAGMATIGLALSLAILPFWWWLLTHSLPQVEIPHPTREGIFRTGKEAELFFWGVYGGVLLLVPVGLWSVRQRVDLYPITGLAILLGLLGLGLLTPLPRVLFAYRDLWSWMTYERFTVWAAVLSVIPAGVWLSQAMTSRYRSVAAPLIAMVLLLGVAREGTFAVNQGILPDPLSSWEEAEILRFLAGDNHSDWRYVTFGLGEAQVARLSRLTAAHTVDGTYYTGREAQPLRESGIGIIDASYWWGESSYKFLFPMLQEPDKWNLRWAVTADRWIEQHLHNSGWQPIHPLGSDETWRPGDPIRSLVWFWKAPDSAMVPPIPPTQSPPLPPVWGGLLPLMWGLVPLTLLALAVAAGSWDMTRSGREQSPSLLSPPVSSRKYLDQAVAHRT
jgi:hypothetical protein